MKQLTFSYLDSSFAELEGEFKAMERKRQIVNAFDRYQEPLPKVEFVRYNSHGAVVHQFVDTSQKNPDIPDSLHNFEQGQSQRRNEHLDDQRLNDRDFRQRCVVYGNKLFWLYIKAPVNFKVPFYLDPAWIASKLDIKIDTAIQIAKGFMALGLNKQQCLDMLFKDAIYWEHIKRGVEKAIPAYRVVSTEEPQKDEQKQ